ncbi:hypothetical protein [Streptomyces sp. NPDC001502]|uniref:hypothetical protein n=1 Tax=Streptomyces sp. NPDC001502 TaxID=3364578 RepID=UPI0036A56DB6
MIERVMNDFSGVAGVILLLLVMLSNLTRTGRTKRRRSYARVRGRVRVRKPQESARAEHAALWWARARELEDLGDAAGAERAMHEARASEARARHAAAGGETHVGHASAVSKAALAEAAAREPARKEDREAERRIALALLFVPPGQRERYRQEWLNEMMQLRPAEAATFALHLLLLAPRMGILLWLKRAFGRRPA